MKSNTRKRVIKAAILGVLCTFMLVTLIPRIKTIWELTERKDILEERKIILQQEHKILKNQKDWIDSPEAIEQIAREQLGMVKDGEKHLIPFTNN
jgi:hypothetical protein